MHATDQHAEWRSHVTNWLMLAALWAVFYCSFTLFTPALLDDADSVHAEVAREMLLRHDYVTLYANGIRYLEKAPLFYWSEALALRLFGPVTWATRLPLAFAVLGLALLSEVFTRRASPIPAGVTARRAGLYAGLITLSSFGIFIFSRTNIPDLMVCFLLTAAMFAFLSTEQQEVPARWTCLLFAAACALDVLTKGLIGIVFPLGIVAVTLLLTRGVRGAWQRLSRLHLLPSALLFFLIATPWHVLAALANPGHGHPGPLTHAGGHWSVPYPTDGSVHGWAWFYFINEQVYRYLNIRVPHDYDTDPLWLFYLWVILCLLPWSAFLPAAIAQALPLREAAWRARLLGFRLHAEERTEVLLIVWAVLPLLFFSLSTRQEYYVLPSLPPMVFLIARVLAGAEETDNNKGKMRRSGRTPQSGTVRSFSEMWGSFASLRMTNVRVGRTSGRGRLRVSFAVLAGLGLAAGGVCLFLILHTRPPAPDTDLASLLGQNPGDYALSFGHFLDLNARALGMFRLPLALTAIAFGTLLPLAWLIRQRSMFAAVAMVACAAFLFLAASHQGLVIFSPTLTSYQLAERIAPQLRPGDMIALHGEYEAGSTLGFYLRRNDLHIVEGRSSNLWYGSFFPDAPRLFETPASMAGRWTGPQRIFLWQDPHDSDRLPLQLPRPVYVVAQSGGKEILSNQPNR